MRLFQCLLLSTASLLSNASCSENQAAEDPFKIAIEKIDSGEALIGIEYLKEAAKTDPNAQYLLGIIYQDESSAAIVKKNYKEAFKWLHKSAVQGNVEAEYQVALLYLQGKGTALNHRKAMEWLNRAALKNHAQAQFDLGIMYLKGESVPKSIKDAAHWFDLSISNGNENANAKTASDYCQRGLKKPSLNIIQKKHDFSAKKPSIEIDFINSEDFDFAPEFEFLGHVDPGHHKILYWVNGFPHDTPLVYSFKRIVGKGGLLKKEATLNNGPYRYCLLSSRGYLPGEKIEIEVAKKEGKLKANVSFIPNPMIAKSQDSNVVMKAELQSIGSETIYIVNIDGFKSDEEITYKSQSGKEIITNKVSIKAGKPILIVYTPDTVSENGGVGKVEVIRSKTGEILSLTFPWGTQLLEYLEGNKIYK